MLKIVIIEDEDKTLDFLTKTIKGYCSDVEIIGTAKDVK